MDAIPLEKRFVDTAPNGIAGEVHFSALSQDLGHVPLLGEQKGNFSRAGAED